MKRLEVLRVGNRWRLTHCLGVKVDISLPTFHLYDGHPAIYLKCDSETGCLLSGSETYIMKQRNMIRIMIIIRA